MLNSSASMWLGITFVVIGAINVWLVLQASAHVRDTKAGTRLITAHRIGGYIFIALFCVMGYYMMARLGDTAGGAPPNTMIHMTLAMILSPLLFVKVLIARYYKAYYSVLMPVGLAIFVLSFVLIAIAAGPSLAHYARMQTISLKTVGLPSASVDLDQAAAAMEKRCTKCHNLDRIIGARKDARGWAATVNRMKALPDSGISQKDSQIIVSYLTSQMAPKGAESLEVARALVDQRCGRCHNLDRVYSTAETPAQWSATVNRMANYAAGSTGALQPGEVRQIVAYLSATQTLEAVERRQVQVAAPSAIQNAANQQAAGAPDPPLRKQYDRNGIAFLALVCSGFVALILRRPAKAQVAYAKPDILSANDPVGNRAANSPSPLILRLASITQQTPDAKTLRFIVHDGWKPKARPGQFLTFSFLFDGKKVVRSYTICSSPARSGYIEITPKRVSQGCASVFLHDRAEVGMTVEANGVFGQFYFDESKHHNVVLLAAGSGITPMMAMLRYMDDLRLQTNVTLLFCVRTAKDIIFRRELEELRASLKNFQYHVLLSQPHQGWSGPRGHINRKFIETTVSEIASRDFFLCGPQFFMEAGHTILTGLGVKPERILQESFGSNGSKGTHPVPEAPEVGVVVEFVRSGKACTARSNQTMLETAEEHGIAISSSCRQGQCGTCKTKLLAGQVRMDTEAGLDPDSKAKGYVLMCVGHAEGAVKLDA